MKVVCINDSDRPSKIPENEWIKLGEKYTVIRVVRLALQKDKLGFFLKEVKLSKSCFPYEFYAAERFAIDESPLIEAEEIKEADLDSF